MATLEALKAMAAVALLFAAWLAVQRAWQRCFGGADGDALAGRTGCGSCKPNEPCRRECRSGDGSTQGD